MANNVIGEMYEKIDGQLLEIKRQIRQKSGYPYDLEKLQVALQAIIEGRFPEISKHDKTQDGWKILEDVPFSGHFIPDIKEFLNTGESGVNGEEIKKRAIELNAHLGQKHAEYLLSVFVPVF